MWRKSKAGGTEANCLDSCTPATKSKKSHGERSGTKSITCSSSAITPERMAQGISHKRLDCYSLRTQCPGGSMFQFTIFSLVPHSRGWFDTRTSHHDAHARRHCQQMTATIYTFIDKVHQCDSAELNRVTPLREIWCWQERFLLLFFSIFLHPAMDHLYLWLLDNKGWIPLYCSTAFKILWYMHTWSKAHQSSGRGRLDSVSSIDQSGLKF